MPDKPSIALKLVEMRHDRWAVYDNTGRLVIMCSNRRIAERYANNTPVSGSKAARRPTRQSEDE